MGDRYFLTVICPKCKFIEEDVYYAPTCGFTKWKCPICKHKIDLEKYTGITKKDASNKEKLEKIWRQLEFTDLL